jgi:hypothetical protein
VSRCRLQSAARSVRRKSTSREHGIGAASEYQLELGLTLDKLLDMLVQKVFGKLTLDINLSSKSTLDCRENVSS